jgi:hypothetical protein
VKALFLEGVRMAVETSETEELVSRPRQELPKRKQKR